MANLNSYDLSRNWFNFCFDNPDKIKPGHTAVYFFAIEHCNRLGWKQKFGFPTTMVMEAIGIKSYTTYIKILTELVEFGVFKMVERSTNQFSANIIELTNIGKPTVKALDKAMIKHKAKQVESTVSVDKQINKEQINKETIDKIYSLYPTRCKIANRSTNKGKNDKAKIKKMLSSISKDLLINTIKWYLVENKNNYILNFSTFLNNLPEIEVKESKQMTSNDIRLVEKEEEESLLKIYHVPADEYNFYTRKELISKMKAGDYKTIKEVYA